MYLLYVVNRTIGAAAALNVIYFTSSMLIIKLYINTFLKTRMVTLMSRVTRKPTFCICENKDADKLRGNREADQRLCFRYIDSTIPLLSRSEISSI